MGFAKPSSFLTHATHNPHPTTQLTAQRPTMYRGMDGAHDDDLTSIFSEDTFATRETGAEEEGLFILPDSGWRYETADEEPTIEEQEILANIQDLQRKLFDIREEHDLQDETKGGGGADGGRDQEAPAAIPSGRLIMVSNRLPVTMSWDEDAGRNVFKMSAGGLVQALSGAQKELDFLWIGWLGFEVEDAEKPLIRKQLFEEHNCLPVFLPRDTAEKYYNGFSNDVLWPLFHYEPLPSFTQMGAAVTKFDLSQWEAYKEVNASFAEVRKRWEGER